MASDKECEGQAHIEGKRKTAERFTVMVIDLLLSRVKYISRDNKLRKFYFKLLRRIIVTKRKLHFFGLEKDTLCDYCRENDPLFIHFVTATSLKNFTWKLLNGLIKKIPPLSRYLQLKFYSAKPPSRPIRL